jgi:hypothetical protein
LLSIALSACGGGGGGDGGGGAGASSLPPPSPWPVSGNYVAILKASGSTTAGATTLSLSLVHPATPQVEYVMDSSPASSSLGLTLYGGTYAAAGNQFTNLSPVAYVDAPNGLLRTTALAANGSRPQQSTGPTQALCPSSLVANDFADPFATVVLATTPGADGTCGTPDDGQVMIGFSSTGVPYTTAASGTIGFLRSSSTGAPSYWLVTDSSGAETMTPFGSGGAATVVGIGTPGASVSYGRVEDLSDSLLYSRSGALMGLGNGTGSFIRQTLSTSTGPEGWKGAGNDATYAYAYLNSGTSQSGTGTWQLLAVARASLAVTTIATGTGSILEASAVPGAVYATVLDASTGAHVSKVSAPSGAQSTLWASATTVTAVEANPGGINAVVAASGAGAASLSLSLIDDQGNGFYSQSPGVLYGADSDTIDGASGDQVFAGAYVVAPSSSTYLGGVPLTRVDAASRTSTVVGSLPSGADLGGSASDMVFVTPILADRAFGGFHASRLSGTQIVSAGSAVYTFNPGQADSIVRTTSQVH